jgi:hypothetical protein
LGAKLKAVYAILVSSAETTGTFRAGFDIVDLHRPTPKKKLLSGQCATAAPRAAISVSSAAVSLVPCAITLRVVSSPALM